MNYHRPFVFYVLFSCCFYFHKAVFIAVNIYEARTSKLEASFCVAFRIKFDHLQAISRHIGNKRYKVTFFHRVGNSNEVLVFNLFYTNFVVFIYFFSFKWWKCNAAATDYCFARCVKNVTANWAHIEF